MKYRGSKIPPAPRWLPDGSAAKADGDVWYDTVTGEIKMFVHGKTVIVGESQF